MEQAGSIIKTERERRGWSQKDLALRVGVSQVAIKKIESGETRKSKHLPKIAQELDLQLSRLDSSLDRTREEYAKHSASERHQSRSHALKTFAMGDVVGSEDDLPVYGAAQGGRGVPVLTNEPFAHIPRPLPLRGRKDCFAVVVVDDSMAREYNHGEIAYVDPNIPPRKGDACLFISEAADGTHEAVIKYLDRPPHTSESVWYVEQTNPHRKFTLKKSAWQKCHVLVGKHSGGR